MLMHWYLNKISAADAAERTSLLRSKEWWHTRSSSIYPKNIIHQIKCKRILERNAASIIIRLIEEIWLWNYTENKMHFIKLVKTDAVTQLVYVVNKIYLLASVNRAWICEWHFFFVYHSERCLRKQISLSWTCMRKSTCKQVSIKRFSSKINY